MILLSSMAWRELFKILNFIIWNQFIDRKSDWFTSSSFNMGHMDTWQSRDTSGAVSILQIVQKDFNSYSNRALIKTHWQWQKPKPQNVAKS